MAEYEELSIKVKVESSEITDLRKQITDVDKEIMELGRRKALIKLELDKDSTNKQLKKDLASIDKQLTAFTKEREVLITAKTENFGEASDEIQKVTSSVEEFNDTVGKDFPAKLSSMKQVLVALAKESETRVKLAQDNLDKAKAELTSLEDTNRTSLKVMVTKQQLAQATDKVAQAQRELDSAQKQATLSAKGLEAAQQKLTNVEKSFKNITRMFGGPWGLAMLAAGAGVKALMNAQEEGKRTAEEYGKRMDSIGEYYNKVASEAANATDWTSRLTEEQVKGLERHRKKIKEEIDSNIAELERLVMWLEKKFTETGQEIEIPFSFKTEQGRKAAEEIRDIVEQFKNTKMSAEDARSAIEGVIDRLRDAGKDKSIKGLTDDIKQFEKGLLDAFPLLEKLINLKKQEFDADTALSEEQRTQILIDREYERSKDARIKATEERIAAIKRHIATLEEESEAMRIATIVLRDLEKQLTDLQKTPEPKASRGSAKSDPLADAQKAIAERQELYEADKWVAEQTIADEKKRRARLLQIDKDYFAEYEKLLDKSYTEQAKKGKGLSDVQIAELIRVQDMRKQLATDNSAIEALEKEYAAKQQIADQTIADAKQLEAVTLALQTSLAEKKKEVLTTIAMTERESFGSMSEATKQALQGIETDLTSLKEKSKEAAKDMAKEFNEALQEIGQHLNSLASSMGGFLDSFYDARIQSMDKAHERELRMIDNRLQAELAMYEEQLEAFEDLDERRADAQREHEERLAEFNEKIQGHMTEEQWRATQEQIDAEEERYNEQMLILDDEALRRDEIMIQQEMAEAEALARKELMEKEYAIRRAKMERKQAEVNKATAIFQALISNGMAISRAFAEHMYPFSAVVAGIVGAATLAQVAAIAARPLPAIPSFKDGGIVGKANIQHFKHLPQPDNSQDKTLIWAQEGEMVVPKGFFENMYIDQYATTAPIANAIMSRIEGAGGRSIYQASSEPSNVTNNTGHTMTMNVHPNGGVSEAQAKRIADRAINRMLRG